MALGQALGLAVKIPRTTGPWPLLPLLAWLLPHPLASGLGKPTKEGPSRAAVRMYCGSTPHPGHLLPGTVQPTHSPGS